MKIKDIDKQYIYERDNKKCFFCGKLLKYNKITLDHYLPRSKKGTTDVFNLVTCCKFCNISKGNRIPNDYKETILNLFLKAVHDNRITKASIKIPQKELSTELSKVVRIEDLTDNFIFQSNTKRFYIKNNKVYKIVHLASLSEDNSI